MKPFSVQTIHALAEAVTGGAAYDNSKPIGLYRSGPKLERFFGALNIELRIGNGSRVPTVIEALSRANKQEPEAIIRVIEAVSDPRDFLNEPDKHTAVVEYLNKRLKYEGYELRANGNLWKLFSLGTGSIAAESFGTAITVLDYSSVEADLQRALSQADNDPEDAITSACSTVESVCKCILDDMGKEYPAKQDIRGLVTEVSKHLNLSPGREDLPSEWAADIKQILGGLASVTGGIGALRTHAGDAHGRGKRKAPVDSRIARLAIHAASTVSLFFIETWNRMSAGDK
jgi:Abortive infection C-terminus